MADKSFGIKELNLVSSGTPKIESSGNLNLNAVTVAINNNATVGGNLDVDGTTELDGLNVDGTATATSFVKSGGTSSQYLMADGSTSTGGSGTTINNNADNRVITGSNSANTLEAESTLTYDGTTLTATSFSGSGNDIVTSRWNVVGGGVYAFTGPGGLSSASKPKIYLARGQTYEFVISNASSHPFQIQQANGTVYNTGVTNNGSSVNGVVVKFEVPFSAPNTLQYVCTVHGGMGNTIIVYPDLSP